MSNITNGKKTIYCREWNFVKSWHISNQNQKKGNLIDEMIIDK